MPRYTVAWIIDIETDTAEQAALEAAQYLPADNNTSEATHFTVFTEEQWEQVRHNTATNYDLSPFFKELRREHKGEKE